jgi:hypothetical protein
VPTFAALGKFDYVPGRPMTTQPWAEAFAGAPPPFGSGPDAPGITPVSSGSAETGEVHRYYAFDAAQNEGTLRVIVLDNSLGSLEKSAEGQRPWLEQQLAKRSRKRGCRSWSSPRAPCETCTPPTEKTAKKSPRCSRAHGVLAVFTTNGSSGPGNASRSPRTRPAPPGS